ncbi:unnamed protein product [Ostreobium quekettii]|uniref:General transcription and DNA repair factor IIH subunit TFB4 n=1 Tax=Ostreobium quekettii TaxID=121088 RepID=A0A8S1J6L9_9CHLO|nr:unnamed protein product [Ostreobium quekettii]|eukprot:evm.model.scf_202.8 EVM.evm.TU.scf_202.8   scf_202:74700-75748(-)
MLPSSMMLQRLKELNRKHPNRGKGGEPLAPALSGALSRALCFLHKASKTRLSRNSRPRILCFMVSPDQPAEYVSVMNAIFSAQRSNVSIDACYMGKESSSFLQQAAHLTGGTYMKPELQSALLQYLNMAFAADTATRGFLTENAGQAVNFKASCFCHRKPIDLGFVCSVCLAVFCQNVKECQICGTHFMPLLTKTQKRDEGATAAQGSALPSK